VCVCVRVFDDIKSFLSFINPLIYVYNLLSAVQNSFCVFVITVSVFCGRVCVYIQVCMLCHISREIEGKLNV